MNNKEWLYSLDPHELTEWFESEHDSNDTLGVKKVVSVHTGTANDANVSEHVETTNGTSDGARTALDDENDSREKLEADVQKFSQVYYTSNLLVYDKVIELLDRQAAITERELCKQCEWPSLAAQPDQEAYDRIAELQAQVDALQAQAYMLNAERYSLADDWKACSREVELYRARLSDLLDAVQEAWRVGQYGFTIVDMEGDVIS